MPEIRLIAADLDGKLTLGENIADLSGMAIAYKAYRLSLGKGEGPVIDGYSSSQRFFLGWAQVWASNMRPEFARLITNVDPHPLPRFRIAAPLANLPAFAQAFSCRAEDPMVRPESERCTVW